MYFRVDQDNHAFIMKTSDEAPEMVAPLADFDFVSGFAFHPTQDALLITAVRKGDRLPGFRPPYRGDLKLYRYDHAGQIWQQIYRDYAHDPTPIANSTDTAIHTGGGLAILDANGRLKAKQRVSNFNWGAPALSSSPEGTKIGMVRWRGDHSHLFGYEIAQARGMQYKQSCFSYVWHDEDHIVYETMTRLNILDLVTGKHHKYPDQSLSLRAPFRESFGDDPVLNDFLNGLKKIDSYQFSMLKSAQGRIFVSMGVVATHTRIYDSQFHCVLSVGKSQGDVRVEHVWEPQLGRAITDFEVNEDGTLALEISQYEKGRLVGAQWEAAGGGNSLLAHGWGVLPTGQRPNSGFHYIGQFEQPARP